MGCEKGSSLLSSKFHPDVPHYVSVFLDVLIEKKPKALRELGMCMSELLRSDHAPAWPIKWRSQGYTQNYGRQKRRWRRLGRCLWNFSALEKLAVSIRPQCPYRVIHTVRHMGWVGLDLGIPQCRMTALPLLPVFHLPKQNWAESGTT